jgi:hypothetical protein
VVLDQRGALLALALLAWGCSMAEQFQVQGDSVIGTAKVPDLLVDGPLDTPMGGTMEGGSPDVAEAIHETVDNGGLCQAPVLTLVNLQIDGQADAATVPAGATVPLTFTWFVSNSSAEPDLATQIVLHFDDPSGGVICFGVGVAPQCPQSQSGEFLGTILMPSVPGDAELIATLQTGSACLLAPDEPVTGLLSESMATISLTDPGDGNHLPTVSDVTVTPHRPGTVLVAATVVDEDLDPVSLHCEVRTPAGDFVPCTNHPLANTQGIDTRWSGAKVEFEWLAQKDLGKGTTKDVVIRLTPLDPAGTGAAAESAPFDFLGPGFGFLDATDALLPPMAGDTRGIAIGDVDGDLDPDIVVSLAYQSNLLLRNQGDAPFAVEVLPGGSFESQPAALLDVDGDGDLDIFVPNVNSPSRLLLNDGSGQFEDATLQWVGEDFSFQIERALSADLDGDLDPDLILLCSGSQQERFLRNDGATFSDVTAAAMPADAKMAAGGSLGTIDNVGSPDLVFNSFISNQSLALWVNDAGVFTDGSSRIKTPYEAMGFDAIFVDLNLDGYQDIIEINMMNVQRVLLNDQNGYYSALPGAFPSDLGAWQDGVVLAVDGECGDVNLDGIPDLVLGCSGQTPGNNRNLMLLGSGMGSFTEFQETFPDDGGDTRLVKLFDLDLDGDLDLFVANALAQSRLYINE